ncbi:MAG TPA: AMP-binding protein, partial [Streptosporangiaceae bacterium]|nr:AMP-binding protein [Streptosporangiaceae bacterium]
RTVIDSLRSWAEQDPDHPLIAEHATPDSRRTCSYGEAVAAAESIGQGLLDLGLGPDRPLLILSGNGVDHLLMTLGAMMAGIPVAPVSVAYSVQSRDHRRIKAITDLIRPGAVFADNARKFSAALDAVGDIPAILAAGGRPGARSLGDLIATVPGLALNEAYAALTPDSVAKILYTSGSTGTPKAVLNTHRMLASNQKMIQRVWPFLVGQSQRPVIVDWLPWSHALGGNLNVNLVITAGGTLYVDEGRPVPQFFPRTIANLAIAPPTIYFNVPAGYALLVPALEADLDFAARFFSRLQLMVSVGAALPAGLHERLDALSGQVTGRPIPVTGSWGATETAAAVTAAHYPPADPRGIGVPLPGMQVKLVPADDVYEIRAKGPNVTPGYFGRPDLTARAFDGDGFFLTGDAATFADPGDPNAGLVFAGRLAENFKLATGTFVRVAEVRTALLARAPVLSDVVIAGEDRPYATALAWLNPDRARAVIGTEVWRLGDLIASQPLAQVLGPALADHNANHGPAGRIERIALLAGPPDLDAGEITDKGYVNQRRVLANRAATVDLLYANTAPRGVITPAPIGLAPQVRGDLAGRDRDHRVRAEVPLSGSGSQLDGGWRRAAWLLR